MLCALLSAWTAVIQVDHEQFPPFLKAPVLNVVQFVRVLPSSGVLSGRGAAKRRVDGT